MEKGSERAKSRREKVFIESASYCQQLVDAFADAFFIHDLKKGRVLGANRAARKMFGYSKTEILKLTLKDIVETGGNFTLKEAQEVIQKALKKPQIIEWRAKKKNGNSFWVQACIAISKFNGQRFIFVTVREIDSKLKINEELRQSEARFKGFFDSAAVGLALASPDGRWIRVNQKLCSIVGYSEKELLKRTFKDITYPDDLGTDLAYIKQLLKGDIETFSMEKRYFRRNKSIVWVNLTVSLVRNEDGAAEYFVAVIEDISERKELEKELRGKIEELEHFSDLVVGRELKMVELKKRISLLEKIAKEK